MMTEIRPSAIDFEAVQRDCCGRLQDGACNYRACYRAAQCAALLRLVREAKGFVELELLQAADMRRPQ
jgi:hypothetical protein